MKKILFPMFVCLITLSSMAEVAVVVNPSNESQFDSKSIQRIFLLRTSSYTSGEVAQPVTQPIDSAISQEFGSVVLGKNMSRVSDMWNKVSFSGRAAKPEEFSDDIAVIDYVSSNSAAIGFIDASAVTDAVKVVARY